MVRIRFISRNKHKLDESAIILAPLNIEVVAVNLRIEELQTEDIVRLVRDKTLKAFAILGRPLFVEQTGLFLDRLDGLPGGLTQIFWDTLGAERVCELFGQGDEVGVLAKTWIGYCDGRKIRQFEGEIRGRIAAAPRGDQSFQWDCVFIPEGYDQTFAELGDQKNQISMRRKALNSFAEHLERNRIA